MPDAPIAKRPVAKPFARLLVADEFRIENNGKLLAIGLYADNVVIFKVPKNAPPPTAEQPYGLDCLSMVVALGGFVGEEKVRITLGNNPPVEQIVPLQAGKSANLHLPIRPFTISAFGIKYLVIEFAGEKFKLPFEIRADYVEAVENLDAYLQVVTRHQPRKLPKGAVAEATIVEKTRDSKPKGKPRTKRA